MTNVKKVYGEFKKRILEGDRQGCAEITKKLIDAGVPLKELYLNLFQNVMYEIGVMWEENLITPAAEHIATGITEYCMSLAYPLIFGAEHTGRSAVIACPVNEYHQVGARMVADFFELHGWHGYFVGANTPVKSLLGMITAKKPDIVGLSLSIYSNLPALISVIDEIRAHLPDVRIITGGTGLKNGVEVMKKKYPEIPVISTIDLLERIINEYR